jgi:hypothetical protein
VIRLEELLLYIQEIVSAHYAPLVEETEKPHVGTQIAGFVWIFFLKMDVKKRLLEGCLIVSLLVTYPKEIIYKGII